MLMSTIYSVLTKQTNNQLIIFYISSDENNKHDYILIMCYFKYFNNAILKLLLFLSRYTILYTSKLYVKLKQK